MTGRLIRIATRSSELALRQAKIVQSALEARGFECELVTFKTTGDKKLDEPLSEIGAKGLFTHELEVTLSKKKVDCCVHSLKDLPTELPEGLMLGAVVLQVTHHLLSAASFQGPSQGNDDLVANLIGSLGAGIYEEVLFRFLLLSLLGWLLFRWSEAFGLPANVSAALDRRVTIPMSVEADSLSVNAAAAVLLWALRSSPDGAR